MDAPFIYRVHEKPETDSMERFLEFAAFLGLDVRVDLETMGQKDLQNPRPLSL